MQKKQKLTLNRGERLVGEVSFGLLGILGLLLVSPTVMTETEALNEPAWTELRTSLAVGLDEMVEVNIAPTAGGTTGVATANLRVWTENASKHRIYVNTLDDTNVMTNVNTTTEAGIVALEGERSLGDLATNTWGVAVTKGTVGAETLYRGMPETAEVLLVNDGTEAMMDEGYQVNFGMKIDTNLPAGQYANDVVVSVIASPNEIQGLLGIEYMQDMTAAVCTNTRGVNGVATVAVGQEPTKQLIDTRDGKAYWVSKLADQNCWMTQDLALDLKAGMELTNADTDLVSKEKWVVPTTTETAVPTYEENPSTTTARSWNLGEYVLKRPVEAETCEWAGSGDKWTSVLPGQTLDRCSNVQNVKGWMDDFVAQVVDTDYTAVDAEKKAYDAHYAIGNYYQFNAATAESGGDLVSTGAETDWTKLVEASDSICPKGWMMLKSGRNIISGAPYNVFRSYFQLLRAYGYPDMPLDYDLSSMDGYTAIVNETGADARKSPIYLNGGGMIDVRYGSLRLVGRGGNGWSRTISPRAGAAFLASWSSLIWPSSDNVESIGASVRCVAR